MKKMSAKKVSAKKAAAKKITKKGGISRKISGEKIVTGRARSAHDFEVGAYLYCATHGLRYPRGESCPNCP